VERGEFNDEDGSFERNRQYLKQGQIESMRQSLDVARGKWIEHYMHWMTRTTRERFEQNKNVLYVDFHSLDSNDEVRWITDTIRELPWLTSISGTTPLLIDDLSGSDLEDFLDNYPKLAQKTGKFIFLCHPVHFALAISFVGPTSGNLILRIKHRSSFPDQTLVVKGTPFVLPVPWSFTVDDISLYHTTFEPDWQTFNPGTRKHLIIQVTGDPSLYSLDDVQLLDESGNRYDPATG
jgi:hypothetical protein